MDTSKDVIVLNKDKSYTIISEEDLVKKDKTEIKYVLFSNDTDTKTNVFAFIKGKHLDVSTHYDFEVVYLLTDDLTGGYGEFHTMINGNSLANKYSLVPVLTQLFDLYAILELEPPAYLERITINIRKDGIHVATLDSDDDEIFDIIKSYGSTSDVFNIFCKMNGFSSRLILKEKSWEIIKPSDYETADDQIRKSTNVGYVGIPSAELSLITLVSRYEYDLLSMIDCVAGIIYIADKDEDFYVDSCEYNSLPDIITLLNVIPQNLRFFLISDQIPVSRYVISIDIKRTLYDEADNIQITLLRSDIETGQVYLLPMVIGALEEYVLEVSCQ